MFYIRETYKKTSIRKLIWYTLGERRIGCDPTEKEKGL